MERSGMMTPTIWFLSALFFFFSSGSLLAQEEQGESGTDALRKSEEALRGQIQQLAEENLKAADEEVEEVIRKAGEQSLEGLDYSLTALRKAKENIEEKKRALDDAKREIQESKETLSEVERLEARSKIEAKKESLEDAKWRIDDLKDSLEEVKSRIEKQKDMLDEAKHRVDEAGWGAELRIENYEKNLERVTSRLAEKFPGLGAHQVALELKEQELEDVVLSHGNAGLVTLLLFEKARLCREAGMLDEAAQELRNIIEQNVSEITTHAARLAFMEILLEQTKSQEAIAELEKIIADPAIPPKAKRDAIYGIINLSGEDVQSKIRTINRLLQKLTEMPGYLLNNLGFGRKSNQEIASKYEREWLNQISNPGLFLKTGFALYDVKRYDEALAVFEKMEEKVGERRYEAIALIWQGHVLDLLGKRDEAISRYQKVAGMGVGVEVHVHHDQFGLAYSPSPYAKQRISTPFTRVENLDDD